MRWLRSLAFPFAVLSLSVVPVRADGPAPDLPPPAGAAPRVKLTTRVIDVAPDVAARWRDAAHPAWRVLDDAESARLLERQTENVITTTETGVLFGERSTFELLNKTSYIADYDVETGGMAGACTVDPVVQTVVAGTQLDVVPRGRGGDVVLRLDLRHTWVPPIRTERVSLSTAAASKVSIQFPEVAGRSWSGEVSVPKGAHLLLLGTEGIPGVKGEGSTRMILLTATAVASGEAR